jgi:murein DD-endopeptidase MepM/ murein hydrolase activator NlpD
MQQKKGRPTIGYLRFEVSPARMEVAGRMRFYAADKKESKKIVDRLWMDVADGRVSKRTARKVYVRRKAFSTRSVRSGIDKIFGRSLIESIGAVCAIGLILAIAIGFCSMRKANEELRLSNENLGEEYTDVKNTLTANIAALHNVIEDYEKLTAEQKEQLKDREEDILKTKAYIEELEEKHQKDLSEITQAEEAKLQELVDMINDLDIFDSVASRSGDLYLAARETDYAAEIIRNVLGETGQADGLIQHLEEESSEISYYLDHYPDYYPVNGIAVTSSYGWRRDPFTGEPKFHSGLDIGCDHGSSVWASASGTVVEAGEKGSYGYCVLIDHGNGFKTRYAHLSKILVKVGEEVQKGERIAYSGMTGRATGPHLHFEVILNGETQSPLKYIGG